MQQHLAIISLIMKPNRCFLLSPLDQFMNSLMICPPPSLRRVFGGRMQTYPFSELVLEQQAQQVVGNSEPDRSADYEHFLQPSRKRTLHTETTASDNTISTVHRAGRYITNNILIRWSINSTYSIYFIKKITLEIFLKLPCE